MDVPCVKAGVGFNGGNSQGRVELVQREGYRARKDE